MEVVERWRIFEKALPGNRIEGQFTYDGMTRSVHGFSNGDGTATVRFSPDMVGTWEYSISSDLGDTNGIFTCEPARPGNHGPVKVDGMALNYADGTRFLSFGTTCYGWVHQPEELRKQTIASLECSPFNKVRMCLFPKWMVYNHGEPKRFPFLKDAEGNWDVSQPDPDFWNNFEDQIRALDEIGVEADLILFHPYDKWGFAALSRSECLTYLDYCVSRLSAFKNVWWSLANEYDLLPGKTEEDWDAFAARITKQDVQGHLLSIHNCCQPYPVRDWMTHCSIQTNHCRRTVTLGWEYKKPVLIDECGYEGNIEFAWGNLSPFALVDRFWTTVCCGGWCTHGETFYQSDEVLWWGKGGKLRGESVPRIAFLRSLLESLPGPPAAALAVLPADPNGGDPNGGEMAPFGAAMQRMPEDARNAHIAELIPMVCCGDGWQLTYLGRACPAWLDVQCPSEGTYIAEIIDVWNMTRVPVNTICGMGRVELPGREGQAVLLQKIQK